MATIGPTLRELRRRRRLSIRELALRSGVSHSGISLMERDAISPSVDTLAAVLDALGTTLPAFFGSLQSGQPPRVFHRASDLVEIGNVASISYRMVGADRPDRHMLLLHERYAPGADTGEMISHSAQEAGIVIAGQVEVTVGSETALLRPGDGYYFDSQVPHRFRTASTEICEIVSAGTPPTY